MCHGAVIGNQLGSGSWDNSVGIWDINKLQNITMLNGHSKPVYSVAWSPDGNQLASGL